MPGDINKYDFSEIKLANFNRISDDSFSLDIKYALRIDIKNEGEIDNTQKMDATWVFKIEPLDGSWCINEIINK